MRDLKAAFAKIGRVKKASVMYNPHTHESCGFGFVTMKSVEEAEAAVMALNATELMGKAMAIEKYDPRPYDSCYARDYDHGDRRGGRGRYDGRPPRDYDRGYHDFDRGPHNYDRGYGREPRDYDCCHDDKRY